MYGDGLEWLTQSIDRASVHEIDADEASELKRAADDALGGLSQAQEKKRNEGNGDLNADRVFADADEVGDPQGLLDPAKKQLDFPALLVKIGDVLSQRIEVVGHDAENFAGLDHDANFTNRVVHGIFAAIGEPLRKKANAIAEDFSALGAVVLVHDGQGRVLLEPRHEPAAGIVDLRPPGVIVKA